MKLVDKQRNPRYEALAEGAHLDQFRKISIPGENWSGDNPSKWHELVFENKPVHLPDERVGRKHVLALSANKVVPNTELFSAVMAWGGMNRGFARRVLKTPEVLFDIMNSLRGGELSRSDAYDTFAQARLERHLVGMGPSYFTKLIFFLDPKHDGYILDQWSGKSANLIFGTELVKINSSSQIVKGRLQHNVMLANRNAGAHYEEFCRVVEHLASDLGVTPEDAELRMFSTGGRRGVPAGAWRRYVQQHYLPAKTPKTRL